MSNCIAFIPAKGNSNRLPRKNMRMCAGKTLVQRAVECADQSGIFRSIVVSTDDRETFLLAEQWGARVHWRPREFSADGVGVAAVLAGYLGAVHGHPDSFCVLWPTSPLRTPQILQEMWEKFQTEKLKSLHSAWFDEKWAEYEGGGYRHEGTAILMQTQEFLKRLSLDLLEDDEVFEIESQFVCDINTAKDLAKAERRLLEREASCHTQT